jgi:hypothetical protein
MDSWNIALAIAVAWSWRFARELTSAKTVAHRSQTRLATVCPGMAISPQTSSPQSTNLASLYLPAYGLAPMQIAATQDTGLASRNRRKQ